MKDTNKQKYSYSVVLEQFSHLFHQHNLLVLATHSTVLSVTLYTKPDYIW